MHYFNKRESISFRTFFKKAAILFSKTMLSTWLLTLIQQIQSQASYYVLLTILEARHKQTAAISQG